MAESTSRRSLRAIQLDQLVATYAPIGAQQKRRQKIRRGVTIAGTAAAVAAGALLSVSDLSLRDRIGAHLPVVATAISQSDVDRLNRERGEFATRLELLEKRLADVQLQEQDLESQRAEFLQQSALLAGLLDQTDTEQSSLERRQQQGTQLDQEIAAIAKQRQTLEQRWAQFEAQGELLAMEIIAVNAQRKELESQRRQIDQQRQELAEMLERVDGLYKRSASSSELESARGTGSQDTREDDFIYTNNSLMVDNTELDDMRGGFSIGDGMDVSFGFAQTGTVNGVDQFSNSFTIDSMASGIDNIDMSNMNSVLLQNGTGNFVSSGVLDAMSDNFGNIIQNTLDDQVISTTTIFDISLQNVPGTLQGLYGEQALMDSLGSF